MNHVEKLIKNFRETEKKLKAARKRIQSLEDREEKYQQIRKRLREMKKQLRFLEHKISTLETKEKDYKLVRIYPTQNVKQCGNKE